MAVFASFSPRSAYFAETCSLNFLALARSRSSHGRGENISILTAECIESIPKYKLTHVYFFCTPFSRLSLSRSLVFFFCLVRRVSSSPLLFHFVAHFSLSRALSLPFCGWVHSRKMIISSAHT